MLVTPEVARSLIWDAPINESKVQEYAKIMAEGEWNGPIKIRDGKVLNGHHRLRAVILAGVPVEFEVIEVPSWKS
jgi:ParB-like chromosome segregation protein Spo0J